MRNCILACAVSALLALPGAAATITWDFTHGGSQSGSGYGNSWTFTADGISVTATGWGLTGGLLNTKFQTAEVGRYSTGLGICDRDELCIFPEHQVDNVFRYEFMLFQFSAPVSPVSITINPYGFFDRDVTYYAGSTAMPLDLTGNRLSDLSGLGFGAAINSDAAAGSGPLAVPLPADPVNSILFGARIGNDRDDWFKITSLSADPLAAPEPGTYMLLGAGLAALGIARRFRSR
jgi:hypothetical protein